MLIFAQRLTLWPFKILVMMTSNRFWSQKCKIWILVFPCRFLAKKSRNLKNALACSSLLKGSACDHSKFSSWCPLTDSEVKNLKFEFQFFLADSLQKSQGILKTLYHAHFCSKVQLVTPQNSCHDVLWQILKSKIQNLNFSSSLQISCRKVKES